MLLQGLLFDAVGNITSLLFSVPFSGFQYHVGFSTRSHLSVIAPFLKAVSGICQKNCINTHPLVSFAYLPTASRFVYQLQTERLSGKGPFPSLAPQSGTVSQLTFAPQILLLHSDRLLKHTFERVTSYPTKSSHCSVLHSHHHALYTFSSPASNLVEHASMDVTISLVYFAVDSLRCCCNVSYRSPASLMCEFWCLRIFPG